MKNKLVLLAVSLLIFITGCRKFDYKPSTYNNSPDSPLESFFPDSIGDMQVYPKLEYSNDTCASISASYGDNQKVYIKIIYVKTGYDAAEVFNNDIVYYFKNLKVKKQFNNFQLYAYDDNFTYVSWINDDFVYYIKCSNDLIDSTFEQLSYITAK